MDTATDMYFVRAALARDVTLTEISANLDLIERYSLTTCRMTFDVRLTEIVTFEEQRSIKGARQCVRKAVAEIEPSRMASLPNFDQRFRECRKPLARD